MEQICARASDGQIELRGFRWVGECDLLPGLVFGLRL